MIGKYIHHQLPRTVDEAAHYLLSDLLIQQLQALSEMTARDFDLMCDHVTPYLIEEFKLWQGNDALLHACFARNEDTTDPARIILNRAKQILSDFNLYIVIT